MRPPVATSIDWNDSPDAADLIVTAESEVLIIAGVGVEDVDDVCVIVCIVVAVGGSTTFGINSSR